MQTVINLHHLGSNDKPVWGQHRHSVFWTNILNPWIWELQMQRVEFLFASVDSKLLMQKKGVDHLGVHQQMDQ